MNEYNLTPRCVGSGRFATTLARTVIRTIAVVMVIVSLFSLMLANASVGFAGDDARDVADSRADSQTDWQATALGINGYYRAGRWTAVRIADPVETMTIETTDGDGVAVIYQQQFLEDSRPAGASVFGYCIPGTEAAPMVLRGRDGNGTEERVLIKTRFAETGVPAEGPAMIPIEMAWVVVFGDPIGIETIGVNELLNRDASIAVTRIQNAASIPDHPLGFSGVDMIVVSGSGADVLQAMSPPQQNAMENWVRGGGRLFVTLGATAPATLKAAPWLTRLLPEEVSQSTVVQMDPSGLETFTNSQTRLTSFSGWQLPRTIAAGGLTTSNVGEVLIAGRTSRKIGLPLAVRYSTGFGKVTVVAADLDSAPFVEWPERLDLITKLTGVLLTEDRSEVGSSFRLSGYSDLSGQVRRSLDQFTLKRQVSFSVLALIIAALIALVAPLDYFLVRRAFGNPLWGWLTFPIVAILMSLALVFASRPNVVSGPTNSSNLRDASDTNEVQGSAVDLQINSIELLDLDTETQTGRLFRWSYLYSHPAQSVQVVAEPSDSLDALVRATKYQVLHPFGAPGRSMGGIQIDSWNDPMLVPIRRLAQVDADIDPRDVMPLETSMRSLEVAPRSSKSMALQMQFDSSLEATAVDRRRGSDLLKGKLTNPLGVDLLDSMLVYQNLVYLLPTRFPAGETIQEVDLLRQKNFKWQLSRQRALESSSQTEAWDVTRSDQIPRLAEMLMFHDVVGGIRYTGLQNEILGHLDFTDLLTKDQCILVGRCAQPWTTLSVTPTSGQPRSDQNHSWVRVILPVQEVRR